MVAKCYWCGDDAPTKEHVPPKCIFPELKDSLDGKNRRLELITVPSCEEHNSDKSDDDAYLLGVLAINILNNDVGNEQAKTKVKRALEKNPGLAQDLLNEFVQLEVEAVEGGGRERTVGFRLDNDKLVSQFEHMSRALYFHEYGERWTEAIVSFMEFQVAIEGDDARDTNQRYEDIRADLDELFADIECKGENPDTFYYQMVDRLDDANMLILRYTFYGETRAVSKLSRDDA